MVLLCLSHCSPGSYSLDYCSFIVRLDIESCQSVLQYWGDYPRAFVSPYKLQDQLINVHQMTSAYGCLSCFCQYDRVSDESNRRKRVYVCSWFDIVKKAAGHLYPHPGNREVNPGVLILFHRHSLPNPSLWMVLPISKRLCPPQLNLSGNVLIEIFIAMFPWWF